MRHKPQKILRNRQMIPAAWFAAALTICYTILELAEPDGRFRDFFTLLLSGALLYLLYLSIQKRRFLEKEFIFFTCLIFIVNRLYDPFVFETRFHFPLKWGVAAVIALYLFRILLPALKSALFWFRKKTGRKEQGCAKAQSLDAAGKKAVWPGNGERKENRISPSEFLLAAAILGMSLWFSTVFIKRLMEYQDSDIRRLMSNVSSLVPLILIGTLSTVIIFILLCTYSKLIKVIIGILRGEDSPAIYVIGIMVISVFLTERGYFNQDRMLNLLSRGDIFSLPIAALIIYPVFVLSTHAINQLLRDHNVYQKMLGRTTALAKRVLKIGYDIINSSITLVETVTCDFLGSLIEIINEEDEEDSEYE